MLIFVLSSLFHLTVGSGDPVALQTRVSFEPSRTITSLLLWESSIFGGTENNKNTLKTERENWEHKTINKLVLKHCDCCLSAS